MVRKKFTFLKVSRKSRRNLRLNWPWRIEICGDPRPSFRILVLCGGFWVWWHIIRSNLIKFLVVIFFQVTMMHWAAGEEAHCVKLVSAHHYHHLGNSSSSLLRPPSAAPPPPCSGRRLPAAGLGTLPQQQRHTQDNQALIKCIIDKLQTYVNLQLTFYWHQNCSNLVPIRKWNKNSSFLLKFYSRRLFQCRN